MLKYFLIILALFISFSSYENLKADEGEEIFSGVISQIDADSDGKLEAVHILLNDGTTKRFEVSSGEKPTEFGLENIAGERWVGNQNAHPIMAATQLAEHQKRLAPITVVSKGNEAVEIVDREQRNVSTNLIYLFVCFAVAWLSFFGYLFIISGRIRSKN